MRNMNSKIFFFILILLVQSEWSNAQIGIGPFDKGGMQIEYKEHSDKKLNELASTTTYFIYHMDLMSRAPQLENTLNEIWNVSKGIKLISYDDFKKGKFKEDASFIYLNGLFAFESSAGSLLSITPYLELWIYDAENERKYTYAKSMLYSDHKKMRGIRRLNYKDAVGELTTKIKYHNLDLGYIKNMLQFINDGLLKKETYIFYDKSRTTDEVTNLSKSVLYIPSYLKIKYGAFNSITNNLDLDNVFSDYPYEYKVMDSDKLSAMILNSSEPIYYLSFIKANYLNFLSVINGKTGSVVYTNMFKGGNIKAKRIKTLSKAIR